jgi:hypothetical protein
MPFALDKMAKICYHMLLQNDGFHLYGRCSEPTALPNLEGEDDKHMAKPRPTKGTGAPPRPEHTVILMVPKLPGPARVMLFDSKGDPAAGIPVLIRVNDDPTAPVRTTGEGFADIPVPVPAGAKEVFVQAEVVLPNGAKSERRKVPVTVPSAAAIPADAPKLEIFRESVKRGPGDFFYYLAVFDHRLNRYIACRITAMPKGPVFVYHRNGRSFFWENGQPASTIQPFDLFVPVTGLVIRLCAVESGLLEIDLVPEPDPKSHQELKFYGPPRRPIPFDVSPLEHLLVRLFSGCV